MRRDSWPSWKAEILQPLWRFPLPMLFAVAVVALNWGEPELRAAYNAAQLILSVYCMAAFLWTWAAALWAEARSQRLTGLLVGLAGAILLALVFRLDLAMPFWSAQNRDSGIGLSISHSFLLGALLLAPSLAPYLDRTSSQSAFWQYNHKWAIGYLTAGLGSILAFAGVSSILATGALLFEVSAPGWVYGQVWMVSSLLILPWIWLALSPGNFREETKTGAEQEFTSRAVGLLVVYILIPVTLVLSAMLAAYIVKVIAEGSFSTARLGLTSAVYGASIILVALLAYPQRAEHPLVRLFWTAWPFLLIAPSLLLFPALWLRVAEYGWTPTRYFAAIIGIWVAGVMVVGLLQRGRQDLRLIPGLLAVLLAATAFGPWGVGNVPARSQYARLETLLIAKGLLIDGRWRAPDGAIPWEGSPGQYGPIVVTGGQDRKIASSALDTLSRTGQLYRLRPWFEGQPDSPFDSRVPGQAFEAIQQKMGLRAANPQAGVSTGIFFGVSNPATIALTGETGTLIGPVAVNTAQVRQTSETVAGQVTLVLEGKQLHIELDQQRIASFDLSATLDSIRVPGAPAPGRSPPPVPSRRAAMMLGATGDAKAKLAITFISGTLGDTDAQTNIQLTGYVLLPTSQ